MKLLKTIFISFLVVLFIQCGTNVDKVDTVSNSKDSLILNENNTDTTTQKDSFHTIGLVTIHDSLFAYQSTNNGKYGYKNRAGKIIIWPKFDYACEFYENHAPVIKNQRHDFIDTAGNFKLLTKFQFVNQVSELSGETFLIANGEGFIGVTDGKNKCGYMNYEGELIIPCSFEKAAKFSGGLAAVMQNGKYGYIDKKGNTIIDFEFQNANFFAHNRACVTLNNKKGFINNKGEMVIKPVYNHAFYFSEGLAYVSLTEDYNNYFYIDTTGKTIIKGPFENASPFMNGKAEVQKNGKCLEINTVGKTLKYTGTHCFEGC
jgi:hypothetical protein